MSRTRYPAAKITGLCRLADFSRQAFYKERKERKRQSVEHGKVVEAVRPHRKVHPYMGVRKLLKLIEGDLEDKGIAMGRDRLFEILRHADLLVKRRRRRARTTDSRRSGKTPPNAVRHIVPSMADQVWASDLTYVSTDEGFLYVSLVTDLYSRKIVGYHAGSTLEAEGCVWALRMGQKGLRDGARPIHHSDRGSQYCSKVYRKQLAERGMMASMTERNHCYENAIAERVNGILKEEYGLGETFRTRKQAIAAVGQAVRIYNDLRPHMSLNYRTPSSVYGERRAGVRCASPSALRAAPSGLLYDGEIVHPPVPPAAPSATIGPPLRG